MVETIPAILTGVAAVMASVGAIISARNNKHSKTAAKQSTQANDAVNHRHVTGTPRLYDLALENRERAKELIDWKRGYDGGPLDSGVKVEEMMEEFRAMKDQMKCRGGKDQP
jgi:hypothetical protein